MTPPPRDAVPPLDKDTLQRLQTEALVGRDAGQGVWVFAYGALMWDRSFRCDVAYPAVLAGHERRYCIWDERNRGTSDERSLTLGLLPGGECAGLAMHITETDVASEFPKVWRHEMPGGFYRAAWVTVEARKLGPVRALTFVADTAHPMFAGVMEDGAVAAILARTTGSEGAARDYLRQTADALRVAAVPDARMNELVRLAAA